MSSIYALRATDLAARGHSFVVLTVVSSVGTYWSRALRAAYHQRSSAVYNPRLRGLCRERNPAIEWAQVPTGTHRPPFRTTGYAGNRTGTRRVEVLSLSLLALRLVALILVTIGLLQAVANILETVREFNPSHTGYYFKSQLLRPTVLIAGGLMTWALSHPLSGWISTGLFP